MMLHISQFIQASKEVRAAPATPVDRLARRLAVADKTGHGAYITVW
jgi:hypothetical protein